MKFARCHSAYELNEPRLDDPTYFNGFPLQTLSEMQLTNFESCPDEGGIAGWGEVASRAMQKQIFSADQYSPENGWLENQEGRYHFMAYGGGEIIIRGVINEYLGFEVIWE